MPIIGVIASSGDRNVPGAPTIGTATNVPSGRPFNNGRADVTFTAPTYTGGTPITGYTVTSSPGGFTGTGASSPISVTGLQSGVAYTFTVTATNAIGTGPASAASNSITATTVPQAPTIGTATAGSGQATVTFTANATGGSAITGFTATSSPGSITGTGASSPITVTGLTNGTAYTFTVTATNANGTSTASAASNSVTPIVPGNFDSITTTTLSGASTITISSIPSSYKHLQLRTSLRGNSSSALFMRINGISTTASYNYELLSQTSGATTGVAQKISGNSFKIGDLSQAYRMGVVGYFANYASTNINKNVRFYGGGYDSTYDNGSNIQMAGQLDTTGAVSSITIFSSALMQVGYVSLYGIS
jgi:hypothetical protein